MSTAPILGGEQPPTLTEWADQRLREAILGGQFGPGDALVISTLAEQLGLSATPLREALRNLASDGLVVLQSHGKARVAEVDIHEANEIYELRLMLEPEAIARSVTNADAQYRDRVEAAWHALTVSDVAPPSSHAAFHRSLISACDSAWLRRMATTLADRAGLMIGIGASSRPPGYNTAERHRTLKELAVSGDAAGASAELHRHLSTTIEVLRAQLGRDGGAADAGERTTFG